MSEVEPLSLDDQAIDHLLRLHSGTAGARERAEFQRWRRQSAAHEHAAREAEVLWQALGHTQAAARHRRTAQRSWRLPAMAAVLCLALLLGLLAAPHTLVGLYADHSTAVGERRLVQLDDGSRVWLNSGSALSVDFSATRRDVRLYHGEALFEVAKDRQRPFVVSAGDGQVQALGTRFDVDLHGAQAQVTVSEGVVQVASGGAAPLRLGVGQRVSYRPGVAPGAVQALDSSSASAWQRGKLIFNQRPLGEVLAELERYLPERILLRDEVLRRRKISGVFDLDDPQALLTTLERLQPVQITRLPWLILVRPAPRG